MRVVELVSLAVSQPEPITAAFLPADGEDRAVGNGEEWGAERSEDVLAVMPDGTGPRRPERVGERGRPVDGEDVALG